MVRTLLIAQVLALSLMGCGGGDDGTTQRASRGAVDAFLGAYAKQVVPPYKTWQTHAWKAHTQVRDGDLERAELALEARTAWVDVVGDTKWLSKARERQQLVETVKSDDPDFKHATPAQLAALKEIQALAARNQPRVVEARDEAGVRTAALVRLTNGLTYTLDDEPIERAALLETLATSRRPERRLDAWQALLEPARELKSGFAPLRDARTSLAKKLSRADHVEAVAAHYGMKGEEYDAYLAEIESAVRPLYRELHTWLRHQLTEAYLLDDVPKTIPAHWLGDPTMATFSATLELPALDLRPGLAARGSEGMLEDASAWFDGIGLAPLPEDFWKRSSLYPRLADQRYGKLGGASTWNLDLGGDVRVLLSARAEPAWMHASYRELAFAHAALARTDARLPSVLRMMPPDAIIGSLAQWADLAGTAVDRLDGLGYLPDSLGGANDDLLLTALATIPTLAFLTGTVHAYENELYREQLATDQMTTRWWELVKEHQGIAPTTTRTERWADMLAYPPLYQHPGLASEQAISIVIAWHLHVSICEALGIDPRSADVTGHPEVGEVFRRVAVESAYRPWQEVIEELTGAKPTAEALVRHLDPLYRWLQNENDGRIHSMSRLR